jgi:hypothetical protein
VDDLLLDCNNKAWDMKRVYINKWMISYLIVPTKLGIWNVSTLRSGWSLTWLHQQRLGYETSNRSPSFNLVQLLLTTSFNSSWKNAHVEVSQLSTYRFKHFFFPPNENVVIWVFDINFWKIIIIISNFD